MAFNLIAFTKGDQKMIDYLTPPDRGTGNIFKLDAASILVSCPLFCGYLHCSGATCDAALTQSVQQTPDCRLVPGMQGGTGWRNSWWVNVGAVRPPLLLLLLMTEMVRASRMVVTVMVVMQANCLPTCVHKSQAWHGQTEISRIKPLPNFHGGWCKEHTHPMHLFLVVFLQLLPNSHQFWVNFMVLGEEC